MKQPKKDIVWHNPENIDPSTIPEGWRFLVEGEIIPEGEGQWEVWLYSDNGKWTTCGNRVKMGPSFKKEESYIVGYPLPDTHMEEVNEWRPISEWTDGPVWLVRIDDINKSVVLSIEPAGVFRNGYTHFLPAEVPAPPVLEKTQEQKDQDAFKNFYKSVDSKYIVTARMGWAAALAFKQGFNMAANGANALDATIKQVEARNASACSPSGSLEQY